jgi:hypothetical protein
LPTHVGSASEFREVFIMILKLYQPAFNNWLLIAEDLDDPSVWDRFLPCHTVESERWKFENTVKNLAGPNLKLALCRAYLRRGVSVFEYDWTMEEGDILDHAVRVADSFGIELLFSPPNSPKKTAA